VIKPEAVHDRSAWNQALLRLPQAHVLQSWDWGAFKARHGWSAFHWLLKDDAGHPRAAATLLSRRPRLLPLSVLYVPKGPVLDHDDEEAWEAVLGFLMDQARTQRAVLLKIDPDVSVERTSVVERLKARGWQASAEQIQFRNTMTIDLCRSEEDLLADMKSKWRYNVRLAARRGVEIALGTVQDLPLLYDMYRETALRDRFVIRPFAYYQDAWGSFFRSRLAQPLIARVEEEAVAMVILFRFGETAWYMYGASRNQHREKMPNHRLQWEAMRWARAQGCRTYDLWGAPDEPVESDPMWGVYRFKQGFGAVMARHIGAFDFAPSRFLYSLYTTWMPRLLGLMRRRFWLQSE
jgi:lipid II:glycine glycyltransferase (peptidoglycan interpeptide bridge formation enzyme)